jgi:hypothetical protein
MSEERDQQREQQRDTRDQVRRKVDYSVFTWAIGGLGASMLIISGYLFTENANLRTAIAELNGLSDGRVKELSAKLEAEKEKNTTVLVSLAEIKGDIKLIRDQLERQVRTAPVGR